MWGALDFNKAQIIQLGLAQYLQAGMYIVMKFMIIMALALTHFIGHHLHFMIFFMKMMMKIFMTFIYIMRTNLLVFFILLIRRHYPSVVSAIKEQHVPVFHRALPLFAAGTSFLRGMHLPRRDGVCAPPSSPHCARYARLCGVNKMMSLRDIAQWCIYWQARVCPDSSARCKTRCKGFHRFFVPVGTREIPPLLTPLAEWCTRPSLAMRRQTAFPYT